MNTNYISLKNGRLQTAAKLYQYDYGQQLEIHGLVLPATFEVHFSNSTLGVAKTVLGQNNVVSIPDEYLKTGESLFGWIFLHNEADDGETVYEFRIPVIQRAAISDQPPTEEEHSIISQAISVLNSAVEETEQNKAEILQAKEQAELAKDSAAESAENAQATANQIAETLTETLEVIEAKEQNVQQIQTDVRDNLILSEQYKNDAYQQARSSEESADAAIQAKEEVDRQMLLSQAYAQSAEQSASSAAESLASVESLAEQTQALKDQTEELATASVSAKESAQEAQHAAELARDEAIENVNQMSEISERIDATQEYVDKVKAILSSDYSNEIPYPTVGSYVIHDDDLWASVTAINEPEEWTEEHWARVTVGIRLMEIQEAINVIMKMEQAKDMSFNLLKRVCESGRAMEYFKEGDVIYIPWTDYSKVEPVEYSLPFIVVHFGDVVDATGAVHENGMYVMSMYAEPIEIPFDAAEVKRATGTNFVPGYYYYTASNGVYTQRSVPYGNPIPSGTTYYVSNKPSAGNIIRYGFARWSQSAIRQWLNNKTSGDWWTAQHDCDIAPSQTYTSKPGWMYGFNNDWKNFLKPVKIQTAYGETVDTTYDTFFLASLEQFYGEPQYPGVEGEYWQYWKDETRLSAPSNGSATNQNEYRRIPSIENKEGSAVTVFSRSGHTNGYSVWSMHQNGYFYLDSAMNARRCMPVCVLC